MEKISIIVPIYNGEKYLSRCIDSLINQTYTNTEIILLNDGSTDNSVSILKDYERKDKRIKVINKKNTGVSDTRNIGINEAKGEYICFCDCDDMYEKNYVELMYKTIKKHNVDTVKCNYKVINTDNEKISRGNIKELSNKIYNKKEIKDLIIPECLNGNVPCFSYLLMIRKSKLKVNFPLDIAMMEDVVFYLRLLLSINKMYIIESELYTIMYNPEGATNNVKNCERNILNVIKVNKYIKEELQNNNILTDYNLQCININCLNSISDFIFKYYLCSNENIIVFCKNIRTNDFLKIIDETNLKKINIQRKTILRLIKSNRYYLLKLFLKFRKKIHKLRRN